MYKIIEVANTHAGDPEYLLDLIKAFERDTPNTGIKFQPFKYDQIATPDYQWYSVYKDLYFTPEQWMVFIAEASKSKDVWIDLFDLYGIEVLKQNFSNVKGLKLQTSALSNIELFNSLELLDLTHKIIILNIAGRSLEDIDKIIAKFELKLQPQDIWIEVGFQGYPTELQDSGINKISIIKRRYSKKVVFADHVSGTSEEAFWLPILAIGAGADVIEKHVMLEDRKTIYDHYSSVFPKTYFKIVESLDACSALFECDFINSKEIDYFHSSEMKPLMKMARNEGAIISIENDLVYRRTSQIGLTYSQLLLTQQNRRVLSKAKAEWETLNEKDFRPAKIGAIIACRLKSARLKLKALLKIGNLSTVEYCIKNTLRLTAVEEVILATSVTEEDSSLVNYTYSPNVIFFQGSPEDVLDRYLSVAMQRSIDIIVRITADMPFVDDEICQILINSHFETGADYTSAANAAPGTNLEVISTLALSRLKTFFPIAPHSEYMTWYFRNNPDVFRLNIVDLPRDLIRDYRLTLDYPEDLEMFNAIQSHFVSQNRGDFGIRDIFAYLDLNKDIPKINGHLRLRYKTDQTLIRMLNKETKIPPSF